MIYNCATDGVGNSITGRPDDSKKTAFTLIVELIRAGDTDYITRQTYISGTQQASWTRYCISGKWTGWVQTPALNKTTTWMAKQTFSAGLDCVGDISVTGEVEALKYPPETVSTMVTISVVVRYARLSQGEEQRTTVAVLTRSCLSGNMSGLSMKPS